ncbi:hypothetical protein GCM10009733_109820 [Nonomuraea maheshkhaliensis]|uniref:Uncharacterized protein n=1 Tax=Nonomuraea maheshkhaliensis TaxID=419590 RepID=A0ABN2I048_9ACTN
MVQTSLTERPAERRGCSLRAVESYDDAFHGRTLSFLHDPAAQPLVEGDDGRGERSIIPAGGNSPWNDIVRQPCHEDAHTHGRPARPMRSEGPTAGTSMT